MADTLTTIQYLLHTQVDNVCALHIYMSYMDTCTSVDKDTRSNHFIPFIRWVYDTNSKLDYSVLTKYTNHLKSIGDLDKTIIIKISHIRQFLISAERAGLIKDCVYYAKRGRKSNKPTQLVLQVSRINPIPKKKRGRPRKEASLQGYQKTYLYDLFQVDHNYTEKDIKRSFRILARVLHPDHGEGLQEKFLVCKEVYTYLLNTDTRNKYNSYVEGSKYDKDVKVFVESAYRSLGGYSIIESVWG